MKNAKQLKVIECRGTPYEIGQQWGEACRYLIPADFNKDNLSEALARSSYTKEDLSFFNWLGVTCYLPRDVVFAVLQAISESAPAGSRIVFDYLDTDLLIPEKATPRSQEILMMAEQVGERVITFFQSGNAGC